MKNWTRREVLKTGLVAPAVAATVHQAFAGRSAPAGLTGEATVIGSAPAAPAGASPGPTSEPGAGRERLLLDFGWRFHFGHADDPAKDFGLGGARSGTFQKTGHFLPAGVLAFDDGDWQQLDLPHDWTIELPFTNDPALASKAFIRWAEPTRPQASAGTAACSSFQLQMPAGELPSNSTALTGKPWWCSTAFTSAGTAADTIPSVSRSPIS